MIINFFFNLDKNDWFVMGVNLYLDNLKCICNTQHLWHTELFSSFEIYLSKMSTGFGMFRFQYDDSCLNFGLSAIFSSCG